MALTITGRDSFCRTMVLWLHTDCMRQSEFLSILHLMNIGTDTPRWSNLSERSNRDVPPELIQSRNPPRFFFPLVTGFTRGASNLRSVEYVRRQSSHQARRRTRIADHRMAEPKREQRFITNNQLDESSTTRPIGGRRPTTINESTSALSLPSTVISSTSTSDSVSISAFLRQWS